MGPDCGDQVPEDVASIIEDYLQQSRRSSAAETEAAEAEIQPNLDIGGGGDTELPVKRNVVYTLDIWEYGGHPDLATGHQLFLSDCRAVTLVVFDLRQELDSPALVPRTLAHPDTGGRTFLHSYCDEETLFGSNKIWHHHVHGSCCVCPQSWWRWRRSPS